MVRLHVQPASGQPFDHPFDGDSLIIGRSSSSDLTLADQFLSRQHARLFREGGDLLVEDLGSRNGTLLNGRPIRQPTKVSPGDMIRLSGSAITVQEGDGPMSQQSTELDLGHTVLRPASALVESATSSGVSDIRETEQLRQYADRLKVLNEVHGALSTSIELDELFELILDRVFEHLKPEQGVIYLRNPDGTVYPAASRAVSGGETEHLYSETLIREVTEKGMAALVLDAQTDERFAEAKSILISGVRSILAAPLYDPAGSLGMIALNSRVHVRQFAEADMELLTSLASVAALRIRNVALAEEAAQRRVLEEELALARRIQVALLPDNLPEFPGYELYGGNIPSRGVSGDFYEIVPRAEGQELVIFIADVSGKGMAASLLTATLEALTAGAIDGGDSPDDIFEKVSKRLYKRTPPEKYATAFMASLDQAGKIGFANAGHNEGILVRASGEVEHLLTTGMPLGIMPMGEYKLTPLELAPGDSLVLYTDGIVEATDPSDEEYGLERLSDICSKNAQSPPEEMASAIEEHLDDFVQGVPFADDRTLVIVRRNP